MKPVRSRIATATPTPTPTDAPIPKSLLSIAAGDKEASGVGPHVETVEAVVDVTETGVRLDDVVDSELEAASESGLRSSGAGVREVRSVGSAQSL